MHVLLINEGTYPFRWGGVSTWCHLLICDLPDIEFTLFSLVAEPQNELRFTLPANVVNSYTVPLWGISETLETRADLSLAELQRRRQTTLPTAVEQEFLPTFRAFLVDLYTNDSDSEPLGQLIHAMYRFFQRYDFDTTMRSQQIWECFVTTVRGLFPETAARHGYPDATFELWDVTQGLQWLYHWLFPLANRLPQTDIVHASTAGICTMIAVAAKLEYGAAYVLSEHGIYLRERYLAEAATFTSLFLKLLSLRFARRMSHLSYVMADQISPCCDYNQRWEVRNGASQDRLRTIYYGADSGDFAPAGKPVGEPPVVIWVGRINPLKDVLTLLKAAAFVKEVRPDIEFRLFGAAAPEDQGYHAECLALHAELELAATVTFAGYASSPASAYNQGDVVVLCSISEGTPFAILEAMLCGKAVVATAVGGVPEQIEGCGLVVEPRNPRELADAIITLMNDPEHCAALGRAAREIAAQEFTVHQSAEAYRASYERVLGRSPLLEETLDGGMMLTTVAEPGALFESTHGEAITAGQGATTIARPPRLQRDATTATGILTPASRRSTNDQRNRRSFSSSDPTEWIPPDTTAIAEIANDVLQRDAHPIDHFEVTSVLESMGLTDQMAIQRYGAPDTFALAENVLEQIRGMPVRSQVPATAPVHSSASDRPGLRAYGAGVIALLPNLLLLLIINLYAQLGKWSGPQVLALSLGMTAGMLLTNGFVQALMRRASLSLSFGGTRVASRFLRGSLLVAGAILGSIALVALLASSLLGWFTLQERFIFALAFLALSAIWLTASLLSLVRAPVWLSIGLAAGLLAGLAVDRLAQPYSTLHLAFGTLVGFPIVIGVILYRVRPLLARPKGSNPQQTFLPPRTYLVEEARPYFAYGLLYMLFILMPHALGWAGVTGAGQTWNYKLISLEAGLTLALPPLVLASGIAEHALRHFWTIGHTAQRRISGTAPELFGQTLVAFYWRHLRYYLLALALFSLATNMVFQMLIDTRPPPRWLALTNVDALTFVFHAGLVIYLLLGWGWFNCMFCLTLGRPRIAVRAVAIGLLVTFVVGAPLCLELHFSYAAVAFIAGALAFAIVSARATQQLLRSADYYYFSSC